jgi:flagellar protein FlgJ
LAPFTSPAGGGGREGEAAISGKAAASVGERKQRFLESLLPHAETAEAATGVPARFILAQAALESGWGAREIKDAEGQASFNLFGIKAGRGWSGETVETTTTEYRQGIAMKQTQSFRAYADYGAAFTDYANLLRNRYGEALKAGDDAGAFARGLAQGGYATDPAYAGKLKAVIASVAMAGV